MALIHRGPYKPEERVSISSVMENKESSELVICFKKMILPAAVRTDQMKTRTAEGRPIREAAAVIQDRDDGDLDSGGVTEVMRSRQTGMYEDGADRTY